MADEVIESIYDDTRNRRVVIFRRPSGTFGYREEKYYETEAAEGWASLSGRVCHWDTLETAKREIPNNVAWLASRRTKT